MNDFLHSAFYRLAPIAQPHAVAQELKHLAQSVHGAIWVASEGINGAVCGTPDAVHTFEQALHKHAVLGSWLAGMMFKHSHSAIEPFGRLKVVVKPEVVALRVPGQADLPPPDETDDTHVAAQDWRALLQRDDVVVLDNRNHFEYRLGRFQGAVDPGVQRFSDFVAYVQAHAPAWRAQGQTVAMYCTGGIRCDKTAPWMRQLGLTVKQLHGGILHYLQQMPGSDNAWQGQCFVFDKRIALDAALHPVPMALDDVFDARQPQEVWRLERARRLEQFGNAPAGVA